MKLDIVQNKGKEKFKICTQEVLMQTKRFEGTPSSTSSFRATEK